MKFRVVPAALLGVCIIAIGAAAYSLIRSRKQSTQNERPTQPTLAWRAEQASKEGKQYIFFDAPINDYAQPRTLKQALEYYDVVVAEPVRKQSFAEDNNEFIKTWYQFKVLEYLHHRSISDCRTCPPALTPLAEMLPVDLDQILVPRDGGDLIVKGITLSSSEPGFKDFEMNRKYVLFLIIDATKRVGIMEAGPTGTYILNYNDFLQPFSTESNPLGEEIHRKFNNSLTGLTEYLRNQESNP